MTALAHPPAMPPAVSLEWLRDPCRRRSSLKLVLRGLAAGWPMTGPGREQLRTELAALRDRGELSAREAKTAGEILARLG